MLAFDGAIGGGEASWAALHARRAAGGWAVEAGGAGGAVSSSSSVVRGGGFESPWVAWGAHIVVAVFVCTAVRRRRNGCTHQQGGNERCCKFSKDLQEYWWDIWGKGLAHGKRWGGSSSSPPLLLVCVVVVVIISTVVGVGVVVVICIIVIIIQGFIIIIIIVINGGMKFNLKAVADFIACF